MGKSKVKKRKSKDTVAYISAVQIAPCPFCKSDNIILTTDNDPDSPRPMKVLCMDCKTVFVLNMLCSADNIVPALKFWNSRK